VWTVNGRTLDDYFPNKLHQQIVNEPFADAELEGRFDVIARIHGGGITGQAGALRLGVARSPQRDRRRGQPPDAQEGRLLTRDARVKERKKAGLKKARKAPQYSKR
jgi:small subunit ribosomal protein S9